MAKIKKLSLKRAVSLWERSAKKHKGEFDRVNKDLLAMKKALKKCGKKKRCAIGGKIGKRLAGHESYSQGTNVYEQGVRP